MKRLLSLAVLCALALGPAQAFADALEWGVVPMTIRTQTITGDPYDQGYIDSTTATVGLKATIDTTTAFTLPQVYLTADSLINIYVTAEATTAFASGETLYFAIDGSATGQNWTSLNIATCGTCRSGGFGAAGTIVPGTGTSGQLHYNGKASSTSGQVASASGVLGLNNIYGGWAWWPIYRLRILNTIATDHVAEVVRYKVAYQKVKAYQ
jgi:hypothetical protein